MTARHRMADANVVRTGRPNARAVATAANEQQEDGMVATYESGVRETETGLGPMPPTGEPASVHPSTAAVAGHPVHPMVVPIPIGLLTAAVASDIAYAVTRDGFWARASRWLLRGGIVGGLVAGSIGLIDFSTIRSARTPGGVGHASGNVAILALSAVSLVIRRGSPRHVPLAAMALSALAGAMLAVTGWLGGELSYRNGIGVIPDDER
jgi:uncharacterized membrane protein